jgi:hypothetical protein
MAVSNYSGLTINNPQTGIQFTKVTDTSADWASVPNSTYFYDKGDGLVHYKDSLGTVLEIFSSQFTYEIGQYVAAQGGVIMHRWLSTSSLGSPTSGTIQNYLVVDTTDLSTAALWASSTVNISNVESTWDGSTNTANLIAAGAGGGITVGTAAQLCDVSTNAGKNDWYLPAIDELNIMFNNRWDIAQGINLAAGTQLTFVNYWSSTEYPNATFAWYFAFNNGSVNISNKIGTAYVRAVRKFSI